MAPVWGPLFVLPLFSLAHASVTVVANSLQLRSAT